MVLRELIGSRFVHLHLFANETRCREEREEERQTNADLDLVRFDNRSPSQLDALLYSLLTIALSLPRSSSQAQLREKLEASPSLMSWIEMKS